MNLILFFIIIISLLHKTSSSSSSAHEILLSSCSAARHPALCFSSIAASPSLISTTSTPKHVILASLNLTHTAITHSFTQVTHLISSTPTTLTHRERTALKHCIEMFQESVDNLLLITNELILSYNPATNKTKTKSMARVAEDLKILLSAGLTNQESCIDGFSHKAMDRKVRRVVEGGIDLVTRLLQNSLAMVKIFTDPDVKAEAAAAEAAPTWVEEVEAAAPTVGEEVVDVVVAADGSRDFMTVTEAVEAAPEKSERRHVIRIKGREV